MQDQNIPLIDCPVDFLIGDASGKVMNEYGLFPCKIKCGVYALMANGSAKATINITQYNFKKNDVLLLEPGSFLLIHKFSPDAKVYYILFSSAFLDKHTFGNRMSLDALQLHSPILHLEDEHCEVLQGMAELMLKAMNVTPAMLTSEKMIHVFNLLQTSYASYAKTQDDYLVRPQDRKTAIYQEYTRLVMDHYAQWHHVVHYAEAMHLTMPHLCSMVKQVSGRTAGEVINDAILTDAKAQLKITQLPIKEIAQSLGFEDVALFNRFFKARTGQTPKSYRSNG